MWTESYTCRPLFRRCNRGRHRQPLTASGCNNSLCKVSIRYLKILNRWINTWCKWSNNRWLRRNRMTKLMTQLGPYSTFDYTIDYNKFYYELTLDITGYHTCFPSVRVVYPLSVALDLICLELLSFHVLWGCRHCLIGFLDNLLLSVYLIGIGWWSPQPQFLTQVVLQLVENVSEAGARKVCLRVGNSLDHNFGLHIYCGGCLWHNMWEEIHDILSENCNEIFRALKGKVCVVFHLLVSFFVYLRLPCRHLFN